MYDLTNYEGFMRINTCHLDKAFKKTMKGGFIYLIGNKLDKNEERQVLYEDA